MPIFIDRRLNPKDKSLGNRQRFLRRAREELKRSIRDSIRSGKISDVGRRARRSRCPTKRHRASRASRKPRTAAGASTSCRATSISRPAIGMRKPGQGGGGGVRRRR